MTPWTPPYLGDENSDQTSTLSCFKVDKIPNKLFLSEIALIGIEVEIGVQLLSGRVVNEKRKCSTQHKLNLKLEWSLRICRYLN